MQKFTACLRIHSFQRINTVCRFEREYIGRSVTTSLNGRHAFMNANAQR